MHPIHDSKGNVFVSKKVPGRGKFREQRYRIGLSWFPGLRDDFVHGDPAFIGSVKPTGVHA